MPDLASLIDLSTIPDYERGYQDLTLRSRLFLAMLQRRGRITYNHSGTSCVWDVMYSLPQSTGWIGQSLEFGSHNPLLQFSTDWAGMVITDSFDFMGYLKNRGTKTQLVNVWQTKVNNCMEGLKNDFQGELFNTGTDTTKPLGLRSFLGAGTVVVADKIAAPSDTYAGKSTVIASQGGSWETTSTLTSPNASLATDWPYGRGRAEYDCTSPKLVNTVSTSWTGTNTWLANAWRVLNTTRTWMNRTGDVEHQPDLCLLSSDYWDQFKENQEAKTHILMPHKEANDLGFPDALNFEGMAIKGTDFDVPAQNGFILNLNTIEIKCMLDVLFKVIVGRTGKTTVDDFISGQGFNIDDLSNRMVCLFAGQVCYQPKYVAHLYPHAAA